MKAKIFTHAEKYEIFFRFAYILLKINKYRCFIKSDFVSVDDELVVSLMIKVFSPLVCCRSGCFPIISSSFMYCDFHEIQEKGFVFSMSIN